MCKLFKLTGCKKELPGIAVDFWVIEASKLSATPKTELEIGTAASSGYTQAAGDRVTYGEAFAVVDAVNDKWTRFTAVVDNNMLDFKTVGEKGFEAIVNTLKATLSSTSDETRDFVEGLITCGCGYVVIGKKRGTTDRFALGTKESPVTINAIGGTGTKVGDKHSCELTFESTDGLIFRTYPAGLALVEAA